MGRLRQMRGLELGAQPVHVGQDLAAQLPPFRPSGRVGGEQVGELILLPLGLLRWSSSASVIGSAANEACSGETGSASSS